jgi:hypothetical protein
MFATPPQSTLVEVSLMPISEGTLVRLVHRQLDPQAVAFHRVGWEHYMPRLARVAVGADAGADPWRDVAVAIRALRDAGIPMPADGDGE